MAIAPALGFALAGLGGFLVMELADDDKELARLPSAPTTRNKDSFSTTVGATVTPVTSNVNRGAVKSSAASFAGMPRNPFLYGTPMKNGGASKQSHQTASAYQQQLDTANAKLKAEYDKLSSGAKKAGAAAVSKLLNIEPPLTGKESWAKAGKVVGASIGTATGAAVCGPPCATLGAMAGTYLGKKLGPMLGKQWNKLDDYFANAADKIGDKVAKASKDAVNKVKDVIGGIF